MSQYEPFTANAALTLAKGETGGESHVEYDEDVVTVPVPVRHGLDHAEIDRAEPSPA